MKTKRRRWGDFKVQKCIKSSYKFPRFNILLATSFYYLVMIAMVIIFLSGCIEWGGKNITITPKPKPKIENVTNISNITNITNATTNESSIINCEELVGDAMNECIVERAQKYNNIYDCLKLNGSWLKGCINKLAERDLSACNYLNETQDIDDCYLNVSLLYGDFICERITNLTKKEVCYLLFISEKCKNITTTFDRYLCDAIEKNDEGLCEKSGDKDLCLVKFSKEKRNVCLNISGEALRESCKAIIEKNEIRCSYLTGAVKDLCYQIYASELGLCNICDKINISVPYGDDCYKKCAISSNSYYICSKSSDENSKDKCYYDFALEKKNALACNGIMLKMLKRVCYENVAVATLDPTICDYIESAYVNNCYYKVITLPQITYDKCTKMKPSYARDQCFFNIAKNKGDSMFCEYIDDSALKDYCKITVETTVRTT